MESLPALSGYVYWLLTDPVTEERIHTNMNRLRTKVEFPYFMPHVTLTAVFGQTELTSIRQNAERIAHNFAPIRVQSEMISGEEHPYRCLYIKLKKSRPLLNIRRMAFRLMNRNEEDVQF